jgi:tyrosine-protein phosphatase SIW14
MIFSTSYWLPILEATMILSGWSADFRVTGIPNFHQVIPKIYRGGQPQPEAWPQLAKLGIKTVLDLRRPDEHSTVEEAQAVEAAGMKYVNIPMKGMVSPADEQVSQALRLLLSSPGPVFVHCRRGADRTGTIIACYRIEHDNWDNQKALAEAKSMGMSWTQFGLKSYIKSYRRRNPSISVIPKAPAEAAIQN